MLMPTVNDLLMLATRQCDFRFISVPSAELFVEGKGKH